MSKKSSTFVPDLGIVPSATIKRFRVMKKECIFRCQFGGKCYSIYASPHPKFEGRLIYWTYVGRRRYDSGNWSSFEGAIGSILLDYKDFSMSDFGRVWL